MSNGFNNIDDFIDNTHSTTEILFKKGKTIEIFNKEKKYINIVFVGRVCFIYNYFINQKNVRMLLLYVLANMSKISANNTNPRIPILCCLMVFPRQLFPLCFLLICFC